MNHDKLIIVATLILALTCWEDLIGPTDDYSPKMVDSGLIKPRDTGPIREAA